MLCNDMCTRHIYNDGDYITTRGCFYMSSDGSNIVSSNGVWLTCGRFQCWLQDAETDSTCIGAQSSGVAVLSTTLDILLLAQEARVRTHADKTACVGTVTLRVRAHGCC